MPTVGGAAEHRILFLVEIPFCRRRALTQLAASYGLTAIDKKAALMSQIPSGSDLGFEASLFRAADKLRGNMEPSDYKHVALGLIFLKHISDSFEMKRRELLADYPDGAEDPDEYLAENVFWVPPEARWSHLHDAAKLRK